MAGEHNHHCAERSVDRSPSSWDSAGMGAGFPHSQPAELRRGHQPGADNPTPDRYFIREAFRNTVAGQFGNCGRNNLIGPRSGTSTPRP